MEQKELNRKNKIRKDTIFLLSAIGLTICIAILFPQIRQFILDFFEKRILHRNILGFQIWFKTLVSFAIAGICFILFFDYCTLTDSGKAFVQEVKKEIKESLSEIDYRSLLRPALLMLAVYFLGILTIIRANFLYFDDIARTILGNRGWSVWSRYVSDFLSVFIHADTNLTDISPIPQLFAILILAISSLLLVYIVSNKKITAVRLLASIPLGLSPFFLECLSYKFDAPYMALSILVSIVPFLFIARKKAFVFCSVVSLLIMCTTYQVASGIYLLIAFILSFQDWNSRKKSNKEILSFLGTAILTFCFAMVFFRFALMRNTDEQIFDYASAAMYPLAKMIPGVLVNIKNYLATINNDLGMIWKVGIGLVLCFFILKSIDLTAHKKIYSFFVSILFVIVAFILSFGVYSLLEKPLYTPRALFGFGVFLSILCIYIVSDYKKIAVITVLAINWSFFTFAFSYGNALADQTRYAQFRIGILLQDLNSLNLQSDENRTMLFKNSIDYAPSVKNIAKHNPIIEKLVPSRLGDFILDGMYCLDYYNNNQYHINYQMVGNKNFIDFNSMTLPVVFDSYYHTIQCDGKYILVTLKH